MTATYRIEVRDGEGWDLIGSATSWAEAVQVSEEHAGASDAGWFSAGSDNRTVHVRKDARVRITETAG